MKKSTRFLVALSLCLCILSIAVVVVFAVTNFSISTIGHVNFQIKNGVDATISGATLVDIKKTTGSGAMKSFTITRQMSEEDISDLDGYKSWQNIALEFEPYAEGKGKLCFEVKNNSKIADRYVMVRISTSTDITSSMLATPTADFCIAPGLTHNFMVYIAVQDPSNDVTLDDFGLTVELELVTSQDVWNADSDGSYAEGEYEMFFKYSTYDYTTEISQIENCASDLVIPEMIYYNNKIYNVTSIADGATANVCDNITSLSLPRTLTRIGSSAFSNCTNLDGHLIIPSSVEYLGSKAFYNCTTITGSIQLSPLMSRVNSETFMGCNEIVGGSGLVITRNIKYIDASAFAYCSSLERIIFREGLITIGDCAFEGCASLESELDLPKTLTRLGDSCFFECFMIGYDQPLVIPENVTYIGPDAFNSCYALGGVRLPEGLTYIGDSAFSNCKNVCGELVLPTTLTYIGEYAFYLCPFDSGNLIIPEGITIINQYAFAETTFDSTLVLPSTIKTVDDYAFLGVGFDEIIIYAEEPPQLEQTPLTESCPIYVLDNCYSVYKNWRSNDQIHKLSERGSVWYDVRY